MYAGQSNGVVAFATPQLESDGVVVAKLLVPLATQGEPLLLQLLKSYLEEVGKGEVLCKALQFVVTHGGVKSYELRVI
jgi:hypothetical protein